GAVLARIIPAGSLEQIVFRVDALHALEERGVLVVNSPRTIERTVDKLWTTALLAGAGLRVPETVVCERADHAMAAFRSLGGDTIVKPLFGSMGLGMVRVSDEDMAFRAFRTLETLRGVYYVQRAIDHAGCDLRVFVIGGRVLGAIERSAPGGKNNLARGGGGGRGGRPPWRAAGGRAVSRSTRDTPSSPSPPRRRWPPTTPASISCPRATG